MEIIFYKETWILNSVMTGSPIPVGARSNAWVCGRLRAGIVVRIPPGHECLSVVNVVCCQVEVSASDQ